MENTGISKKMWNDYKAREAKANERIAKRMESAKAYGLKNNVTYYNVKAFEAFERGDYTMAADYAELVRRNLERLAAL